jgi:hypothetical protein
MTRRILALAVLASLVSGCIGKNWGTQGVPFFPVSDDLKASLEEFQKLETFLAGKVGEWDLAEVEKHILESSKVVRDKDQYPELIPERHASLGGKQTMVSRVWRFTTLERGTSSLPTYGWRKGLRVGFVLQADETNGKLSRVQTSFTYLPDREKEFSTKPLVAGALAAAGTLILLTAH